MRYHAYVLNLCNHSMKIFFFPDCECHNVGSKNKFCDSMTGQCSCKTNVVGRNCSQCHVNTYNMSMNGCMECTCNTDGSRDLQCGDDGQCPCLDHVTGQKCTQCTMGYYGLPTKPCQGKLWQMPKYSIDVNELNVLPRDCACLSTAFSLYQDSHAVLASTSRLQLASQKIHFKSLNVN